MGQRKDFKANVKLVPAGHLRPNPHHPYARESPVIRREAMLRIVGRGLADLARLDGESTAVTPISGGSVRD